MTTLYVEIDPGSGFKFDHTVICDDYMVDKLVRQLVHTDPQDHQPPTPSPETLAEAGTELRGFLNEDALLTLGYGCVGHKVVAVARRAKDLRWSSVRIRALTT